MKDLNITLKTNENSIDVSEINNEFEGIILCYNNDKLIGYIQYNDEYEDWRLMYTVSTAGNDSDYCEPLLYHTVSKLIKDGVCTNFKIIEFE